MKSVLCVLIFAVAALSPSSAYSVLSKRAQIESDTNYFTYAEDAIPILRKNHNIVFPELFQRRHNFKGAEFYDTRTGTFTAPRTRTYALQITVDGRCPMGTSVKIGFVKNSKTVLDELSIGWDVSWKQSGEFLEKGDTINVRVLDDYKTELCNVEYMEFSFTGI